MKNLILTVSLLFLIGCGSSSDNGGNSVTLKSVDNSSLASGSSQEGYYGKSVKWGNHFASQWWSMTYKGKTERFLLQSNGSGIDEEDIGTAYHFYYGISKDGRIMNRNNGEIIFYIKNATNNRCYNVDLNGEGENGDRITINISMCADGV